MQLYVREETLRPPSSSCPPAGQPAWQLLSVQRRVTPCGHPTGNEEEGTCHGKNLMIPRRKKTKKRSMTYPFYSSCLSSPPSYSFSPFPPWTQSSPPSYHVGCHAYPPMALHLAAWRDCQIWTRACPSYDPPG